MTSHISTYTAAARCFSELVHAIPTERWTGPGLDQWDLRSLIGHTTRSLSTVASYLNSPAAQRDITSSAEYYAYALTVIAEDPDGVLERGRQAGRDLGDHPLTAIDTMLDGALAALANTNDVLISVIGGKGILLSDYLPTRVFELAVHSLDIADATGIECRLPPEVLSAATVLAAQIAATTGRGETVLMSLTGRRSLPPRFSVV